MRKTDSWYFTSWEDAHVSFSCISPMFSIFTIFHYILVGSLGLGRGREERKESNKWKYTLSVLIKIYLIQLQNSI